MATLGAHRDFFCGNWVLFLLFLFCHDIDLAVRERGAGDRAVCVGCACVRVLNNFMDICHAQLTLHCCILSSRPRLGRQ